MLPPKSCRMTTQICAADAHRSYPGEQLNFVKAANRVQYRFRKLTFYLPRADGKTCGRRGPFDRAFLEASLESIEIITHQLAIRRLEEVTRMLAGSVRPGV